MSKFSRYVSVIKLYVLPHLISTLLLKSAVAAPIFENSIVSNDIDFITQNDVSLYHCIRFVGRDRREMPDKRNDQLFVDQSFIFNAHFKDGTTVGIWAHPAFMSREMAQKYAKPVAQAVGKLPTFMRKRLSHIVLHHGDETAFAEHLGHFFVLYSENIRTRIRNHDLDETIFHESVHATLDELYNDSASWRNAQKADGAHITHYAASLPNKEDFAESALFAFTLLHSPERLESGITQKIKEIMPNRMKFFKVLFDPKKPRFSQVGPVRSCNP